MAEFWPTSLCRVFLFSHIEEILGINFLFLNLLQCIIWIPVQPFTNSNPDFHFYWFFFPFRGWVTVVLWILVLLHNPCMMRFNVPNCWPDVPLMAENLTSDFLLKIRIDGFGNCCKSFWSWISKESHQPLCLTAMMTFFFKCCSAFPADIVGYVPSRRRSC